MRRPQLIRRGVAVLWGQKETEQHLDEILKRKAKIRKIEGDGDQKKWDYNQRVNLVQWLRPEHPLGLGREMGTASIQEAWIPLDPV